jgi:hypothetical protein
VKIKVDLLRDAVRAVAPNAWVHHWATSDSIIGVRVPNRHMSIDIWSTARSKARIDCRSIHGPKDRAVLRAVIDEIDRQETT